MSASQIPQTLPAGRGEFWTLLRESVSVTEALLDSVLASNLGQWPVWAFIYLTICLTVRMGPLPDTARGAVGAILILGPLAALVGTTSDLGRNFIQNGWPILSFSTAALFFLMLFTLLVRAAVGFARILSGKS